jgi:hypothetical protein
MASRFEENFTTAFQSYTEAIVYARKHAAGSINLAREVFTDRLLDFQMRAGEVPDNLRGRLVKVWQNEQLDLAELQRALNL